MEGATSHQEVVKGVNPDQIKVINSPYDDTENYWNMHDRLADAVIKGKMSEKAMVAYELGQMNNDELHKSLEE